MISWLPSYSLYTDGHLIPKCPKSGREKQCMCTRGAYCCHQLILFSSIRNHCPSTRESMDEKDILWLIKARNVVDKESYW